MVKRFPELIQQKEVYLDDIISEADKKVNSKCKLKLFDNIINNKSLLHKNWKLMYLDSAMLSADQIQKINYQYDNKESNINKMKLLKILNREGLNFYNIHAFLIALKSSLRNNI